MRFRRPLAVVLLAVLLPFVWCFGSTLTGARVCAYRDAANFYYPLYAWTSRSWLRGEVPLWNPQDGIGTPVAAEATSAVFYPGQLIFALPIDYSLKFSLYIAVHMILAAWGAFVLARYLLAQRTGNAWARSASREEPFPPPLPDSHTAAALRLLAAGFCGLSYAFSGAVLFQYCNIVFLVGAAWLPLALWAAVRMLAQRSLPWALALGTCLALMVLGGDPQAAYHAGLLSALWAWFARSETAPMPPGAQDSDDHTRERRPAMHRHALSLLATAAVSGVCLSAVQIVPAIYWTRESDRAGFAYPRSIYEIAPYLARTRGGEQEPNPQPQNKAKTNWPGVAKGLVGSPVPHTHHQQLYAFSVAPWRLPEYVWPNFSGRMFPRNQRWLSAVRGEDRVWTPTLYLGLMPLLIALATWRLRTPDRRIGWLSWVACGSAIASFGWYGPGWLIGALHTAWTGEPMGETIGEATGGLYWLMVTTLPGYAYFRYPAKLLVITALAVALLAAIGFERVLTSDRRRLRRLLGVLGTGSAVAVCILAVCRGWWPAWFAGSAPDELYGPLDCQGAWLGCLTACAHATLVCGLFWWLFRQAGWPPVRIGGVVLLVTAIELGWANGSSVLTVPSQTMGSGAVLDGPPASQGETVRIYRPPARRWVPQQWLAQSQVERGAATVRWDRATLLPKYHLLGSLGSVDSLNTLVSRNYRAFLEAASADRPHPSLLDAMATRYFVLPAEEDWPAAFARQSETTVEAANARVWINSAPLPRVWIVHQVEHWPLGESSNPAALERRFHAMLFPAGGPRNLRQEAIVETARPETLPAIGPEPAETQSEACRLVSEQACRLEIEAELAAPGLMVLSNLYEPGWILHVATDIEVSAAGENRRADIVRTNGVMQGVFLPAGHHRLVFEYAPRHLYWAAAVSGCSWLLLLICLARRLLAQRVPATESQVRSDSR